MKWKKPGKPSAPLAASIGAGALILLLFLSYLFSSGLLHDRGGIDLSAAEQDAPVIETGGQVLTAQSVSNVTITAQNAQSVIASLSRPTHYSFAVSNTLYYTGGSAVQRCRRYAREDAVRTDVVSETDAVTSTLLRAGDEVYAWNAGESVPYHGVWGDFRDDAAAMLPSYEDVLADGVTVTDAARIDVADEPCIRVVFEQGGYRCVYDVSAVSGLLRAAAFYSGETLVRQIEVTELLTDQPDAAYFALPNGTSVLGDE